MKIQISLAELESIVKEAKERKKYNSSLGATIEFTKVKDCDTHEGSDVFNAELKSGYAECTGVFIR